MKAASDFAQVYGKLGSNDSVLDFGCGTGETTLAIASGQLGNFGKPEKVKYPIRIQETFSMILGFRSRHIQWHGQSLQQ